MLKPTHPPSHSWCPRSLQEHSSLRAAYSELQETLSATEEAFRELEREKDEEEGRGQRLEERVAALQEELAAVEQNNQVGVAYGCGLVGVTGTLNGIEIIFSHERKGYTGRLAYISVPPKDVG